MITALKGSSLREGTDGEENQDGYTTPAKDTEGVHAATCSVLQVFLHTWLVYPAGPK